MADTATQMASLEALKAAQLRHQETAAKNAEKHATTEKVAGGRTFYSNLSGSTYVFSDGTVAAFKNGEYVTNRQAEIEELEKVVAHPANHHIFAEKVQIANASDAVIPKEVGGGTVVNGMVNTSHIAR